MTENEARAIIDEHQHRNHQPWRAQGTYNVLTQSLFALGLSVVQVAQVLSTIENTCHHCWDDDAGCQCWNDE